MRGRAGVEMPPITETDPSILRERLRNERRIELAYEGIRYWDLLRWEIADKVLVGEVWGAPYPSSTTYASSTKEIDPTGIVVGMLDVVIFAIRKIINGLFLCQSRI